MWATWVVLVAAAVILPAAFVTSRNVAEARALMGDLEATLDRFEVGHGDDRYSWVPVLMTSNVPWESSRAMMAVARQHEGAIEVRHGLPDPRESRLPAAHWHRRSWYGSDVAVDYTRPRRPPSPPGPLMLSMAIRPEQVKMFPDVPQKLGFRFGVRYRDVDVRSMLVGVDLASWFDVTVASGDRCVPAVDDAIDGPASARLVVSHDDGFSVWGPNGSFQGRFGLDDASFRRRIGYLRLSTGPAVPDHGDPSGDGMVLKLRPEHAAVLRS